MKSVTQGYLDAWGQKNGKAGFLYVQFKRRYWSEGSAAYVYESNWTQYTMRQFVEVGNITFKLDTPLRNEIKTSSVTLTFKNSDYQLLPTNSTNGIFAPNATTVAAQPANPARGFEQHLTQFQVQFGYKKVDGTIEVCNLFTGVAIDYNFRPKAGRVEVTVSGNEYLLQSMPASLVSTPLTTAATTNVGGWVYNTNVQDIAFITNVYDSGRGTPKLVQGTDYTISNTSTYLSPATITLLTAPVGTITYSGAQWLIAKKLEDLVTTIATTAGIASYNISPVVFPGGTGPTTTAIGVFSGTNYAAAWTRLDSGASAVSGVAGALDVFSGHAGVDGEGTMSTPSTPAYGVWTFPLKYTQLPGSPGNEFAQVHFITASNAVNVNGTPTGAGYHLTIKDGNCQLIRTDTGAVIFSASPPSPLTTFQGQHNWLIARGAAGTFNVFIDNLFVGTGTDNAVVTSAYFITCNDVSEIIIGPGIQNQTAVTLSMADFTNMSCYDALQKLAKLGDYEWGFDGSGTMYFRSKTPANKTPVVTINQSDGISEVLEFRPGYDKITNDAQVTYSGYFSEYNSSSLPEAQPTSQQRFLTQLETEDYTDFLLLYDPLIAAGRAQALHDNNYLPKRTARIKSKILPFVDLSDVVQYSFYNNPRSADNVFGDPLEQWGLSSLGDPADVLARNIPGKVISMILDPKTCTGEYVLEEVL